jgi:hypothetical protein
MRQHRFLGTVLVIVALMPAACASEADDAASADEASGIGGTKATGGSGGGGAVGASGAPATGGSTAAGGSPASGGSAGAAPDAGTAPVDASARSDANHVGAVSFAVTNIPAMSYGLLWNGAAGAWDAFPGAAMGQWMAAQATGGSTAVGIGYGQVDGTVAYAAMDQNDGGEYHTSSCQDSVNYDLHVVSDRFGGATGYRRFHPTRDAKGLIGGFTQTAKVQIAQFGSPGNWNGSSVWEVVDGAGNHRILALRAHDSGGSSDAVDVYAVESTVNAGVTPAQASDWVGLDNSANSTLIGTLPKLATDTNSYDTETDVVQHKTSKKVELLVSQVFHGAGGNHAVVTLTPNGTAWNGALGGPLNSYDSGGGVGSTAVALDDDTVWWAWFDASGVRFSKIDSSGKVTQDPVARPEITTWNSGRIWSIAKDGSLITFIDVSDDSTPVVRGRVWTAGAWGAWIPMGSLPTGYQHYFSAKLQGQSAYLNLTWLGGIVVTNAAGEGSTFVALGAP